MLKFIKNNPFRMLGIYSNARQADIAANCEEMDIYLRAGQPVIFDLDLCNLMQQLQRTTDLIEQAKRQINLPQDKLKYALFWFCQGYGVADAVNHLKRRDFSAANAAFKMNDSFSTWINKATIAFIQGNDAIGIGKVLGLIHNVTLRNNFVEAICGKNFRIEENELSHLFIDAILVEKEPFDAIKLFKTANVNPSDLDYLKTTVAGNLIAAINREIEPAKNVAMRDAGINAEENYNAGQNLKLNTKDNLENLRKIIGNTDMRYQMIADDLALAILHCGINYFNNSGSNDKFEKALKLQEYALDIAVGTKAREKCRENVEILRKQMRFSRITQSLEYINNELQSFQARTDSTANAKRLLDNCKPHLQQIKKTLGNTDEIYLQLSNAVAHNALGMLITLINKTQKDLTKYGVSTLKQVIEDSLSVMANIREMDMTSDERDRLDNNMKTCIDIKNKIDMIEIMPNPVRPTNTNTPSSKSGCYIATMCYGYYDHPQVMVLRDFRDTILQQHSWGRAFVRFYYRHSPNWVEHLKDKKLINKVIRKTLDKFIIIYKYVKK